jgi:ankyrin repeat protein
MTCLSTEKDHQLNTALILAAETGQTHLMPILLKQGIYIRTN